MRVAVVGMWHLGTVTAACVASAGHDVVACDDDARRVADLREGRLPVAEPGLRELSGEQVRQGRLRFDTAPEGVAGAEVVWVAYDTPVDDDDQADVEWVVKRIAALFPHLGRGTLVLISSQLPVGTTAALEKRYRAEHPQGDARFAYVPENLRLGKAIEVFTRADRYVVGTRSEADRARVAALLAPFTSTVEWMSVESAEMTKHALNAFLATSVVFINELATLCERVGADAREVERGLKSDVRIGRRAYLRPGAAFAGGTLARDVSFLIERGRQEGLAVPLFAAVRQSNAGHDAWPRRRLQELLGDLAGRTVAVLGLSYKPGTDTLRRSSALAACRWLRERGATVRAFDPAVAALPAELHGVIDLRPSVAAAVTGADAVVVATEWPVFKQITADELVGWVPRPLVLDAAGFTEDNLGRDPRVRYVTVGRPS